MKVCADENIPEACVSALRSVGHDVLWIRDEAPGASDNEVIAIATAQERVLITFDKDFGDIVFLRRARVPAGIILFRIAADSPPALSDRVVSTLGSRTDWSDHFSVVDQRTIRMRRLH